MAKDFRQLEDRFASYEVNEEGKVRNIKTKKYKTIISDMKGNQMVVLPDELSEDKASVAIYIKDLLFDYFGIEVEADSEDERIRDREMRETMEYVKELEAKIAELEEKGSVSKPRKKVTIVDLATGHEYKGYVAAAKAFGFSYDKFYNAFYDSKKKEIEFGGMQFLKRVDD